MTPPDDAPQTGHRVYRFISDPAVCFSASRMLSGDEPGVWHSLDPKALASTRGAIFAAIEASAGHELALQMNEDAIPALMARLGLTPPEPKEGGASA